MAKHLIIIGAQRAGTTSLYNVLDAHPQIYMARPQVPEPKYFLQETVSHADYLEKVFRDAPMDVTYLGEKSTSYYEVPEVARRIHAVLPDVRLIVQLRNPVERALSNYFFSVKNGLETRSLEEVFIEHTTAPRLKTALSVDPFDYLGRGDYARHLGPYVESFGERLLVTSMEAMVAGLENHRITDFLELDIEFPAIQVVAVNAAERFNVPGPVRDALKLHFKPQLERLAMMNIVDVEQWPLS